MRSPPAFTLIELLVVVVILSLLMALLLPALGRATELARRVACLSNLSQWNILLVTYAHDNDERYPSATRSDVAPNNLRPWEFWFRSLEQLESFPLFIYFQQDSAFWMCPNMARSKGRTFKPYQWGVFWRLMPGYQYCGNGDAQDLNWLNWNKDPHAPRGPADPGAWNLMNDWNYFEWGPFFGQTDGWWTKSVAHVAGGGAVVSWASTPGWFEPQRPDPSEGGNQLFNDGSARWADIDEMEPVWSNTTHEQRWVYR